MPPNLVLAAVSGLFVKAKAVIDKFGSQNPRVAPEAPCRLYFLLAVLQEDGTHLLGPPDFQQRDLETCLAECNALLQQHRPPQPRAEDAALSYAWPVSAEHKLQALLTKIDHEIIRLRFIAREDVQTGRIEDLSTYQLPSEEATIDATRASLARRRGSIEYTEFPVTVLL